MVEGGREPPAAELTHEPRTKLGASREGDHGGGTHKNSEEVHVLLGDHGPRSSGATPRLLGQGFHEGIDAVLWLVVAHGPGGRGGKKRAKKRDDLVDKPDRHAIPVGHI